jgi:hypothetical protein
VSQSLFLTCFLFFSFFLFCLWLKRNRSSTSEATVCHKMVKSPGAHICPVQGRFYALHQAIFMAFLALEIHVHSS